MSIWIIIIIIIIIAYMESQHKNKVLCNHHAFITVHAGNNIAAAVTMYMRTSRLRWSKIVSFSPNALHLSYWHWCNVEVNHDNPSAFPSTTLTTLWISPREIDIDSPSSYSLFLQSAPFSAWLNPQSMSAVSCSSVHNLNCSLLPPPEVPDVSTAF